MERHGASLPLFLVFRNEFQPRPILRGASIRKQFALAAKGANAGDPEGRLGDRLQVKVYCAAVVISG
jgi:hypothetical protein